MLHGENLNEDCGEGPFRATANSFCTSVKILFIANIFRLTVNVVNFYSIDRVLVVEREIFHFYVATIIMCEISRLCETKIGLVVFLLNVCRRR